MSFLFARTQILCLLAILTLSAEPATAELVVASPFQEHMVLQQGVRVPVWGEARRDQRVSVEFAGQTVEAVADANGRWRATLEPMQVSADSRTMTVRCGDEVKTFVDVLVGEVWLASGQSNMEQSVGGSKDAQKEIATANYPLIRSLNVRKRPSVRPEPYVEAKWTVCSPETVGSYSAAGYFFSRELHKRLNVPVGLIHASWGGTAAQVWTPIETLRQVKSINEQITKHDERVASFASPERRDKETQAWVAYDAANADWLKQAAADDPGVRFLAPNLLREPWPTMRMPVESTLFAWHFLGTMWLEKFVEVPKEWIGKDLTLSLGVISDADETYVNDERVGGMWYGDAGHANTPRVYKVRASLVKSEHVSITIRVMNVYSFGGLLGPREQMTLAPADAASSAEPISLAGDWEFHHGIQLNRVDVPRPVGMPTPLFPEPHAPANLYNGMIAPLVPYAMRGAIWYQGEANAGKPEAYRELFPAMIQSWRTAWGDASMPFYFVQLANFNKPQGPEPIEVKGGWSGLREVQLMTLRNVPNTGMAVIIDVGEEDIHPKNKQDVGYRLALWALAKTYKQDVAHSGPLYKSSAVEESGAIRVSFDHVNGGLIAKGDALEGFAIAGEDKVFHTATAVIEGDAVVVSSKAVPKPVAVRYAWATNPRCNLYNQAGLPASPFRTDTWDLNAATAAK